MFTTCSNLAELSAERQRLMREGVPALEVNAAYNKAKKRLMEHVPSFRKIPTFSGPAPVPVTYVALPPVTGLGKPNEIIVTNEGVLL